MITLAYLTVFLLFFVADAANILFLATVSVHSHHFWNSAITNELARRGHNVTVVSPDFDKSAPQGVHYILLENQYNEHYDEHFKGQLEKTVAINPFIDAFSRQKYYSECCEILYETKGFHTLLNYPDDFKFDVILHDFTIGPCFLPFAYKFKNPPLIGVTAYSNPSYTNAVIGGHQYYSYVPHNQIHSDDNMNFWQRLSNMILHIEENYSRQNLLIPKINKIAKRYFGPNLPSVGDIEQRTALVFVNTNPAMDYLAPLPENVIPVGGLHIKDPKPIPKDIKSFIDSSKKGAVVVSLGSNFRSDSMPQAKQQIFLDVFAELTNYHFLWKFESNISSEHLPKNVRLHRWLPLSDILADSNVKAIFFHGGLLSTQEAIERSVPMLIMPFALDQSQNLIKAKRRGVAVGIDYNTLSMSETKKALEKLLEDPSYALNARKLSTMFKDQKEKPLDRAVWWIEWLLRNPNSDYFRSPVLELGLIAGSAYDIIAFILLCITLLFSALIKLVCIWSRKVIPTKNQHINVVKKKHQ